MTATRAPLAPARAARIARRQLWLGVCLATIVALAGWLSTVSISGLPWSSSYLVRLRLAPGAPVLTPGDDVDIGGERVGQVQSVAVARNSGREAIATLSLGGYEIGAGASASVRPRGLAGTVFVDLVPGRVGHPLRSGSLIDATAGVQLTDVIAGFDADARQALAEVLDGYGSGFAGRGVAIGDALARAPSLLANTTSVLRAIRPQPGALTDTIADTDTVAGALAPAGTQTLARLVGSAGQVLRTTGASAPALAATIDGLPAAERASAAVLPETGSLLARITTASSDLAPGVAALADALSGLTRVERSGPAVSELAGVASAAAPALRSLTPALARLIGTASALTPLSDPVAELAAVLIPYETELIQAPLGFTRWGNFTYDFGTGAGHRAVRFSMVLTCADARDPYPAPGEAGKDRKSCP